MAKVHVRISYDAFSDILDLEEDREIIGLHESPDENDEVFKVVTVSFSQQRSWVRTYRKEDLQRELGLEDCKIERVWDCIAENSVALLLSGKGLPFSNDEIPKRCRIVALEDRVRICQM